MIGESLKFMEVLMKIIPPPLSISFAFLLMLSGNPIKALLCYWGLWPKNRCIICGRKGSKLTILEVKQYKADGTINGRIVEVIKEVRIPVCPECVGKYAGGSPLVL